MHGLISKLAGMDSSAERGLRIIEFFDQLVLHRADLEGVTRATAVLAEMTAGAILDEQGEICLVAPDGRVLSPTAPSQDALISEVEIDGATVGRVWLEPDELSHDHEWDELIVARMALALATLRSRRQDSTAAVLGLTDPALLHVLVDPATSEAETARAARLLGFQIGQPVAVIAVASEAEIDPALVLLRRDIADAVQGRTVAAALSRRLAVVVAATTHPPIRLAPPGTAVCVGPLAPVESCAAAWGTARRGVRFAALKGRWPAWTTTDDLGCLLALGDLKPGDAMGFGDVQAIERLSAGKTGDSTLDLLDCFGWLASIRETAIALHMHHSSVAYRLDQISGALGFDVKTADGRYRARTALILWQLNRVPMPHLGG